MEKCFCHFNGYKVKDADAQRMIQQEVKNRATAIEAAKKEMEQSSYAAVNAANAAIAAAAEAAQYAGNVGDIFKVEWEPGEYHFTNGTQNDTQDAYECAIRSSYIPVINGFIGIIVPDDVQIGVFHYNSALEFMYGEEFAGASPFVLNEMESSYVRLHARYEDRRSLAGGDLDELITVYAQRAVPCAVRYDAQTLTDAQKTQARENISAAREVETDEIYFGVTADGVVYLKGEYRGLGGSQYAHSISDNGVGISGTRIFELPEEIVIPRVVNGVEVTGLSVGMFMSNKRVKKVTLHGAITAIPKNCFARANNLEEVNRTENIKTLDSAAFYQTAIKKAYFPSLVTLLGTQHFYGCANLAVADLGKVFFYSGSIVPKKCFGGCEKLEILRNADGIREIGDAGLYATYRLANKTFLPKLTSVGTCGLFLSRVDYEWEKLTGCWFDVMSTSKDVNNYDYSSCTFESCANPIRSMFNQYNPVYGGKYIGGCATVSAAMVYSALMGIEIESPDVFVDVVKNGDTDLKNADIVEMLSSSSPKNGCPELIKCLAAAGLNGVFISDASPAKVQSVYDALKGGALVLARVVADMEYNNHWVVIRGINDAGEVLVVNPGSHAYLQGTSEAATYAMPIQNMMRDAAGNVNTGNVDVKTGGTLYGDDCFVIVTKATE